MLLPPMLEPTPEFPPAASSQQPAKAAGKPSGSSPGVAYTAPALGSAHKALSINLATALSMTDARAIDIALAAERVQTAAAQLARARALWLPTLYVGTDYYRHDGTIQDMSGNIVDANKQSFMAGVGPAAVFNFSDALFAPLAARQALRANQAGRQTATNNSMLAVAEAYFTVQQARGELAGAEDTVGRAQALVGRTEKLAPGLVPSLEITRARTELSRRRQSIQLARERWGTAGAELARLLRLDAAALVEPMEPPQLQVTLVNLDRSVDELIPIALTNRPELGSQQALVQVSLQLLRQERMRPLLPSLLVRGSSTPVTGTLAAGVYGGGVGGALGNFGMRQDWDVQLVWALENMGFGNKARIREQAANNRAALLQLYRAQDQVAADVVTAFTRAQTATARAKEAEQELKSALESVEQNLAGVEQTKRAGEVIILVVRPAEVVAAVQALALAYTDYYGAVADANRAQFRLYWALGRPGGDLLTAATH
ncbi:MAG TPA: TolC family protein [Gemmataceae bacterium]|nr:TolC family protein [Gemmataceae bacterium]